MQADDLIQRDCFDQLQSRKLSAGFPDKMVLLDCETTGGRASYHRITELGLLVIENGAVVEAWQSLINPQRPIPAGITRLTGINQTMVNGAPVFGEIADELLEKLTGRVLVAHHARFDYSFLKREFERVGIRYNDRPLCSVKFSRMLYPQFKKHGLDQIIQRFKLAIKNRHRAMDDAMMIHRFFIKSSDIHEAEEIASVCQQLLQEHTLPVKVRRADVDRLPQSAGVYYFFDERDVLLYVGKSVNIRQRVMSHFSQDHKNHKALKMSASIARIEFDQTATDFGAQILESKQIKSLKPLYNSRLKRVRKLFRLTTSKHRLGHLYPIINSVNVADSDHLVQDNYGLFRSPRQAKQKLQKLADHFFLCHQILGLEASQVDYQRACFRYQLHKCKGVCCGQESIDAHNQRLLKALRGYQQKVWPWSGAILVEECVEHETSWHKFHLVNEWVYLQSIESEEALNACGYALKHHQAVLDVPIRQVEEDMTDHQSFDLDVYFILVRFLLDPAKLELNNIKIHELNNA